MGERENRLGPGAGAKSGNGHQSVDSLVEEADDIREELGGLMGELRRRKDQALDWRRQVKLHPAAVAIAGAALLGAITLTIVRSVRAGAAERRRQQRLVVRLRRLLGFREA